MEFDIIIEHPTVVDGSGKLPYRADVGVVGDKIAAIGQLDDAQAVRRINGQGKMLCPGFVDVHSHADLTIHLTNHQKMLEPLVRQGITTFVGGNCGMALAPLIGKNDKPILQFFEAFIGRATDEFIAWKTFAQFMETIEKRGMLLNMAILAPHGIIRMNQMGQQRRLARPADIKGMSKMVRDCMEAGALGLSTGLQYFPGSQSDTDELVALAKVVSKYDGVFTSHLRSYSNTLELAIEEIKTVSQKAKVPVQISHLFWVPHVSDRIDELVRKITKVGSKIYEYIKIPVPLDAAVAGLLKKVGKEIDAGLPLGIDGMPTSAGFTHLMAFFPPWALEGDRDQVLKRLSDRETRKRMLKDIEQGQSLWPHRDDATWSMNFLKLMGWDGIYIMSVVTEKNRPLQGMNFLQIGKKLGKHPFDAACDLLIEENGRVLVFETFTHPGDDFLERSLFATMKNPHVSIVTDTILLGYGRPSHLFYDCYPKYIARYIRDSKSVSIQEGIRKCTSLPAAQLGIKNRGTIEEGCYADLVLFDLATIDTNSTYEHPDVFPTGIEYVTINGKVVVDPSGFHADQLVGKMVRRGD